MNVDGVDGVDGGAGGLTGGGATDGPLGPGPGPGGLGHHPPANADWDTITVNATPAASCTMKRQLNFFMVPSSSDSDICS
jgi:hypothetical protein